MPLMKIRNDIDDTDELEWMGAKHTKILTLTEAPTTRLLVSQSWVVQKTVLNFVCLVQIR